MLDTLRSDGANHARTASNIPESVTALLYGQKNPVPEKALKQLLKNVKRENTENSLHFATPESSSVDLDAVAARGNFPYRPSDLFLKLYASALQAADEKPHSAVCSPAMTGSSGVCTLSIISIIPDIMQHYHDLICSAQKEVLIATNAWEPGRSVDLVTSAFHELNRRCAQEGRKVVVKVLMDAASARNVLQSRYDRPPKTWAGISVPAPEDIPNLDLQLVNYHVAPLGTFHSKFAVIDREVALVNSNNINIRSNVEMMSRFEGDIVNSLYDTFLISWGNELAGGLPCLNPESRSMAVRDFAFAHSDNTSQHIKELPDHVARYNRSSTLPSAHPNQQHDTGAVLKPHSSGEGAGTGHHDGDLSRLTAQLKIDEERYRREDVPSQSISVNQRLNVMQHAEQSAPPELADDFAPYILHSSHPPVPMALVNRQPYAVPGHQDVVNPQNNAWLAALEYAKRQVFIQSPVVNASPIVEAILKACKRGVEVTVVTGLGFNDFAEGIVPFQGGTNETVHKKLVAELQNHGDGSALKNLIWCWYVAKDQIAPLRFEKQSRNCHVKFMAVDWVVGIMGSGNMDTQSWFHSQEVNVMIDSTLIMDDFRKAFDRQQNSFDYGRVDAQGQLISGEHIEKKKGIGGLKRSQGGFL